MTAACPFDLLLCSDTCRRGSFNCSLVVWTDVMHFVLSCAKNEQRAPIFLAPFSSPTARLKNKCEVRTKHKEKLDEETKLSFSVCVY